MKRKPQVKKLLGRPVVVDTNVIIDLHELDSLFLLNEIFSRVIIPKDTIERELDQYIRESLDQITFEAGIIQSNQGYSVYSKCLQAKSLSHCDRMSIAIAVENNYILCTNEKPARSLAQDFKLELTGTLGILAVAYKTGIINKDQTIHLFRYLSETGSCYISTALLNEVLAELGLSIEED